MGYLGTIYIVHTHHSVKRYLDVKTFNFSVLKIGFHGDTFVAREHNTIWYRYISFFTKIINTTNVVLLAELAINVIKRKLISQKPA